MDIVCIDIGGTSLKGCIIGKNLKIRDRRETPTQAARGADAVLKNIFALAELLRSHAAGRVSGVALSSAGDIDAVTGDVLYATQNLPGFTGLQLARLTGERFSLPVSALNDGQAALLGEISANPALKSAHVAMLTLGTGVGGAAARDGAILFGADFRYGRFGHIPLYGGGGALCTCGKQDCIECYISTAALLKRAAAAGLCCPDGRALMTAASGGNALARGIVASWSEDVAAACKAVSEREECDTLLLGGGIVGSADVWLPSVTARCKADMPSLTVTAAALGNDAGLYGAYRHFIDTKTALQGIKK